MASKYKSNKRVYDSSDDEAQSNKKSKVVSTEAHIDREGNKYWDLSSTRRVQISDFKGTRMIGIREYYQKDGDFLPGKKGISLPLDQFRALLSVLPQLLDHLSSLGDAVDVPDLKARVASSHADEDGDETGGGGDRKHARGGAESGKAGRANHESTSDEE